ncbi:hypothetical protein LCGC14_1437840 [marine sediment metagenome]|uniref:Uncharacterized protein n=1 Tax=marine sediment metagenome TaxID=412755 RepID=A0A0F9JLL3_9ZZZZ
MDCAHRLFYLLRLMRPELTPLLPPCQVENESLSKRAFSCYDAPIVRPRKKPPYVAKIPYKDRQRTRWRTRGGHARARNLSPETRQEIARKGYRAMMEQRYIQILELALFALDTRTIDRERAGVLGRATP